jgi:hypothetical protein
VKRHQRESGEMWPGAAKENVSGIGNVAAAAWRRENRISGGIS